MGIEKIVEIQGEARAIFTLLQKLDAPMSENNVAIIGSCLKSLKLIGQICEKAKEETKEEPKEEVSE